MRMRFLTWAICLVLLMTRASASVLYVSLDSANPTPPYSDWSTAATNIQDAVDAATDGDQVLVTNGVYSSGMRAVHYTLGITTNRVAVTKMLTLQSVNGPQVTSIEGHKLPGSVTGASAFRCVYLTNNAVLVGFTLTNGATLGYGGGIFC